MVDDHRDPTDLVVDGGFEHPPAQGLDERAVGASQETSLERVPLDLLARRDAQVGDDAGQSLGEGARLSSGKIAAAKASRCPSPARGGLARSLSSRKATRIRRIPRFWLSAPAEGPPQSDERVSASQTAYRGSKRDA
ncbi:MAG TPA: hypothetical protein VN969_24925 [Streptosporangiaceae bacterium]|nr:hypothetical protein [Streptosporangiaceae bacterium]